MWRAVESLVPYLTEELRQRAYAYENVVYHTVKNSPRWQQCVYETYDRLPVLLSSLYLGKHFSTHAKARADALVQSVEMKFREVLISKLQMESKVTADNITNFIGYPDELLDVGKIEELYDKLQINPEEYLQAFLNINIRNRELSIRMLRDPVDDRGWFNSRIVADMHTSYNPLRNSLSISAGSLQGLLFNKDLPNYLNYGGIGFTLAREITQGFNWWDSVTNNPGNLECFIEQYNNFTVQDIDEPVNGTSTLTENLANHMGLKIAYDAFQQSMEDSGPQLNLAALEYTPNQLFWISFAANQCSKETPEFKKKLLNKYGNLPAEFRVIGVLENFDDFANDFKCSSLKPMNPSNKCSIWS